MRRLSLGRFSTTTIGVDTETRLRAIEYALGEVELASHVGSVGDLPTTLTDPNADKPLFWSDKKKEFKFLQSGTGIKVDTDDDGEGSINLDLEAGAGIDVAGNTISVEPNLQAINVLPFAPHKIIHITDDDPPTAQLLDFTAGLYTPTATHIAEVTASSPFESMFFRMGPMVGVFGRINIDPTGGTAASLLRLSLPPDHLSVFASEKDATGTACSELNAGRIDAHVATGTVLLHFKSTGTTSDPQDFSFVFWYRILPWPPP